MVEQLLLNLAQAEAPPTRAELREVERFGRMDAISGLPRRDLYSRRLTGDRVDAYDRGYDVGIVEIKGSVP